MIYKLNHDYQNTYSLLIDPVELIRKMPTYRPRHKAKSILHEWVMPSASFFKSENFAGDYEVIPDITTWKLGYLVLNAKAYEFFKSCLSSSGEWLPISINDNVFYIFNPLYIIAESSINKNTAVEIIDSGVHLGQENVFFDESALMRDGVAVFKTNTDQLVYSYCTDQFKKIYEDNGLKGLIFESLSIK